MTTHRWAMTPLPPARSDKSVGQIVAFNVIRARRERSITQTQLADRLRDITGRPWPRSAVTMTENAWAGSADRLRTLDVDQVVAFAIALDMPVSWFFMPPDDEDEFQPDSKAQQITCDSKGHAISAISREQLADIALSLRAPADGHDAMRDRVAKQVPAFLPVLSVEQVVKEVQMNPE